MLGVTEGEAAVGGGNDGLDGARGSVVSLFIGGGGGGGAGRVYVQTCGLLSDIEFARPVSAYCGEPPWE